MKKVTLVLIVMFSVTLLQASTLEVQPERSLIQICNLDAPGLRILNPEDLVIKESKVDTVEIQTSAVCKMCKERLEHDMAFEKGVKDVKLDMDTKKLIIVYRKDKTTEKELKEAITEIGYDADEMIANQKAHDKLPACCQKDVEPH